MTNSTDTTPDKPNPTPAEPTPGDAHDPDLVVPADFDIDKEIDEDEDFEGDDLEADGLEDDLEDDGDDYDDEDEEGEDEDEDDAYPLPPRAPDELDAEEKARLMAATADAVRAEDIEVLDLRSLTIIADYFLICTGKSSIQLRAIADRIEEKMRDAGIRKPRMEGYQEATWILLDYGDVVAHLMAADQRDFYRLEEFWQAAPRLELDLLPAEARANRPTPSSFQTLTPIADAEDDNIV